MEDFMTPELYLYDLVKKFEKINPSDYYLSYSGGADSHFLYWFIKEYAHIEGIEIVSVNTRMEHSEICARMYKYADIVLLPELTPMQSKEKYGIPCFSKNQDYFIDKWQRGLRPPSVVEKVYGTTKSFFNLNKTARRLLLSDDLHRVSAKCCDVLKKAPMKKYEKQSKRKPILGVRGAEGVHRAGKYKSCFTKDGKFTPIYDLSDDLMQEIYEQFNIEIPSVYQHIKRTGCMGCPYGIYKKDCQKELKILNGQQRKYVINLFKESYLARGIIDEDGNLKD